MQKEKLEKSGENGEERQRNQKFFNKVLNKIHIKKNK